MSIQHKTTNYFLKFKHPFKIAAGTRTQTPCVFIELNDSGIKGYGEATLPPYLKETQESVNNFIQSFFNSHFTSVEKVYQEILIESKKVNANMPAIAAIEMACVQLLSKKHNVSVREFLNIKAEPNPLCTFTIGMDNKETILKKLDEAEDFKLLKIKLGGEDDLDTIDTICIQTSKPICIDANQGWKTYDHAVSMLNQLRNFPVVFVEQPLHKENLADMKRLKEISHLPLIADESFQIINDLEKIAACFDGINIKLMKCGGITNALTIIEKAKQLQLKILIGCMSESSCGVAAAAHLAPLVDWVDLDGPLLITNDPFIGVWYDEGKIFLNRNTTVPLSEFSMF
jgi:L-Ala-D/L-Glu epimerase